MFDAGRRSWTASPLATVVALAALAVTAAPPVLAQVAAPNVNMVSGTGWPGGDPFLQRQNEPSVAVSTRNPAHLLAGANDYRTVDLPGLQVGETGDAWLGVFKSFDGGLTWQSTLLPGYPQDQSPAGLASPLKAFTAAADAVVRAGTDGLFYYSGITFNRGSNQGQVFVSRFIDLNNKENGDATQSKDPIRYLDTAVIDSGTSGQFLDKPWLAVDVPRGGATCSIPVSPTQSVLAGNVYLAYAKFTGTNSSSSQVLFVRSTDCGKTWSKPAKLSANDKKNQGTNVAIDPATGAIYVTYRRFETNTNNPDAMVVVKSTDFGQTFTSGVDAALITPFDQFTTPTQFRTATLPAIAASFGADNISRVHLAWAQRLPACAAGQTTGCSANGDARIVVSTSRDGSSWSAPVPVDAAPIKDDTGQAFDAGHQFMPSMTFAEGRLMVLYYDQRLDQTLGRYKPNGASTLDFFSPDPTTGSFYEERRKFLGQQAAFGPTIDEAPLTQIRHLLELRVAEALPADDLTGRFTSARVSRFDFGSNPNVDFSAFGDDLDKDHELEQLEVNPPNLPLFKQGTLPFIGDYIEIAALSFVPNGGGWKHNTEWKASPTFHAVWTSNQDVVPPPDGDWTKYTPPPLKGQQTSVFDPTQPAPVCVTGYEGTRNQNIYTSRIGEGLLVYSPQNAKPLDIARAFVVIAQNTTALARAFRLTLSGATASFQNEKDTAGNPVYTPTPLDVLIPANSSISRAVFAQASPGNNGASITVQVAELDTTSGCALATGTTPGGCGLKDGGLQSTLLLNAPGALNGLTQPDGGSATSISASEVYTPMLSSAAVTSPNFAAVTSAAVTSAAVTSAAVTSAAVTSAAVTSSNVAVPQLAAVTSAAVTSASVTSAAVTSNNISNASVTSSALASVTSGNIYASVTSASISDANYQLTNSGNTTHSYHVKLVGTVPTCPSLSAPCPIQLILSKPYGSPFATNCQLGVSYQAAIVANVDDVSGDVTTNPGDVPNPDIPDPRATNATITLAPGESGVITIRGPFSIDDMKTVAKSLVPAVVPHAGGSYAAGLYIPDGAGLPPMFVGEPYSASLQAIGGTEPYTWSVVAPSTLPAGLSLSSGGLVTGTPTQAGSTTTTTLQVTDSSGGTVTRTITFTVTKGTTALALTVSPSAPVTGQPVTLTATVTPAVPAATGTVTFSDGATALGTGTLANGVATLVTTPSFGPHSFTASYAGDGNYLGSSSPQGVGLSVQPAATAVQAASSANPSVYGQAVTFTVKVSAVAPGSGTPTGTVTVVDGQATLATVPLDATGSATVTTSSPLAVGPHSIAALYGGSTGFLNGTATLAQTVNPASTTTTLASSANPSTFGQSVTLTASVAAVAPGAGTPTGTVTFADGATVLGSAPLANGTASIATSSLSAGNHSITAAYSGDASFATSSSVSLAQSVGTAGTAVALAASPASPVFGQAVALTATVTVVAPGAGTPTGSVTFKDGATVLGSGSLSAAGTATFTTSSLSTTAHSLTAVYAGDASFATNTSAPLAVTVSPAGTTSSLAASPNPSTFGQSVTLTASVTVVAPGAGTPGGQVVFKDGATPLGSGTLSAGVATLSTSALPAGIHSLSAVYAGNASFTTSASAAVAQTVNAVATTTTLVSSANPVAFGQPVTFTATVAPVTPVPGVPAGTVTFRDGALTLGSASLNGSGVATLAVSTLGGGSHSITASYAGGGNFAGSTSAALAQAVNQQPTTTTLTSSANPSLLAKAVTFTAKVTASPGAPTGTVTFKDGTTVLGTASLAAGTATYSTSALKAGSHSITAVYSGDATFAASTSAPLSQAVNYVFSGFGSPLTTAGTMSAPTVSGSWSYSRVLPVKWTLTDGNGTNLTDLTTTASLTATFAGATCPGAATGPTAILYTPTQGAAGGSTFRSGSTGFIFNWDATKNATTGCWWVRLKLNDGSAEKVTTVQLN